MPLLQEPPVVASVSNVVKPAQTLAVPVIEAGKGLTVTLVVVIQPVGKVYEMVTVPADTPVTTPVPEPTVALLVLLLLQVPPVVASVNAVVKPAHTLVVPVIEAGNGFTVTVIVGVLPETE